MESSLFRDRDFRLVAGSVGLSALGAFAAGGLLVAAIGPRGTLAYAGGLSALAGMIGLLALLRLKREGEATDMARVPKRARTESHGLRDEDSRHRA
jgi:hypothetical protein